ncbi:MAG: hypothetical protein E6833_31145, partial [Bradyrhizobium sp.]|nr:hypothetical protein [Bradyrhizobium sp.]
AVAGAQERCIAASPGARFVRSSHPAPAPIGGVPALLIIAGIKASVCDRHPDFRIRICVELGALC